jgi:uncharacterized LabA/DUF88 family protein
MTVQNKIPIEEEDGQDPTQPFLRRRLLFCGLRLLNHGADGVYGVNFVLIETDGSKVDAIVLLEKDGDLNGINGLQAAAGKNGRVFVDGIAISLLRQ